MTQEEQAALVDGQQQNAQAENKTDDKAEIEATEQQQAAEREQTEQQTATGGGHQQIHKMLSELLRFKSFRRSKTTDSSPSERALRASKQAAKASIKAAKFAELAKKAADDASRIAAEISKLAIESAGGDVPKATEDTKPVADESPKQEELAAK